MNSDKTVKNQERFKNAIEKIDGIRFESFVIRENIEIFQNPTTNVVSTLRYSASDIDLRSAWITVILQNYDVRGEFILSYIQKLWAPVYGRVVLSSNYEWVKALLLAQEGGFNLIFIQADNAFFVKFQLFEGEIEATYGTRNLD